MASPFQFCAHYDFRDLARDLRLNVIIVAANRLGVLNHARLTVEAIRAAGLRMFFDRDEFSAGGFRYFPGDQPERS